MAEAETESAPAEAATPAEDARAEPAKRPDAATFRSWAGHRLDEIGGANVGKVEGVFVDEATGEPEWLLARMGRFGHHTLVPARDAVEGVKRVWVPYTRDQIRRGPKCDPTAALTAAAERELLRHYGVMADAGRGAEIGGRDDTDVTSRPG